MPAWARGEAPSARAPTRMQTFVPALRRILLRDERGATMVEYALLVALIALVVIGAVTMLGTAASTRLDQAAQSLSAS